MRFVHLYPFVPRGRHGGTLRLAAAVEASAALGSAEVHYFDPVGGSWHGPLDPAELASMIGESPRAGPPADSLKRRLFPSTLWESGRRPRRVLRSYAALDVGSEDALLLHTTYLAPALAELPRAGARVTDVYDLVWCAHRNDATAARGPVSALRRAYAAAVRRREHGALAGADSLIVAGVADHAELAGAPPARWIPTATPVEPVAAPPPADVVRVGLLGNFAHSSTRKSLDALLASALGHDPSARIVVAGLHAERAASTRDRVDVLGPVRRAEDFYARVDCVVAPVIGGSGIKCKLGEAVLAGRPVVTTPLGAAGYPEELRRRFAVRELGELDAAAVRDAIAAFDPAAARAEFERSLGAAAVAAAYTAALGEALERR